MTYRLFRSVRVVVCVFVFATSSLFAATTIHVPADQPTIQAGINAASNGDTVLVSPGTYAENLNFNGKAITVRSLKGPAVTKIDGSQVGSVVTFSSHETRNSILKGFTITNGLANGAQDSGGGILIYGGGTSPSIIGNVITANSACSQGGGIYVIAGAPLIQGNTISNNFQSGCVGGEGAGIAVDNGESGLEIIGNTISLNVWRSGNGGGMNINAFGSTVIENNLITRNTATGVSPASQGGGIYINAGANVSLIQNLIDGNSADQGGGVYLGAQGGTSETVLNNTIANNISSQEGSAIYVAGSPSNIEFFNNLLIGGKDENAVFCDETFTTVPPFFETNDAFSSDGTDYLGSCVGETGQNGNISIAPLFISKTNYRLIGGSPVIDAGDNAAPGLPATDFAGNSRIINGNDGPTAIVDMGAYEFVPVTIKPSSLNFGLQSVGSTMTKTLTLTNAQNKSLTISSETSPTGYKVSGCGRSVAKFSSCTLTVTFEPSTTGLFKGKISVKDNAGNSPQSISVSGSAH